MNNTIMEKAEQYCTAHKRRFTVPRAEVLRIICAADRPVGAYDIIDELGKTLNNPKPPTVYRAIEFWLAHRFIHCIESLNAYIACKADHHHEGAQFIICETCGEVTETHFCTLPDPIQHNITQRGFTPCRWNIEIYGCCRECRE